MRPALPESDDRKVRLTLCLGPLYDGYEQLSRIAEFFAYYSVMGVQHYRVYINDVSREGAALLQLIKIPSQPALSERPLLVSRALTTRERTPWDYEIRSKYIASTSAVIVGGVHYVIQAANGTEHVHVPVRTLAVNHYRRCCGLVNEKAQQVLVPDEPDLPDVLEDYTIYLYSRRVLSSPVIRVMQKLP
ncbi:hypothetical protein HPB50_017124 [Hyalomma asiaticum]|uniref:Uncharacterized protein n=1 Tax=Hyalomma asiaticum TaxID=266040 RepID=A0ACB7TAM4_HYAAI|nr:hypothetical protein HPB50_017124 [Hyalomma asiaticum]